MMRPLSVVRLLRKGPTAALGAQARRTDRGDIEVPARGPRGSSGFRPWETALLLATGKSFTTNTYRKSTSCLSPLRVQSGEVPAQAQKDRGLQWHTR